MKRFLLCILLMVTVTASRAQVNLYHAFPDSATWRVDYVHFNPFQYPCYANYSLHYSTEGDTLINSLLYKKIVRSNTLMYPINCVNPGGPPAPPAQGYVGALRDDSLSNKTFFRFPNANTDSLLYDYNLTVGDTMKGFIAWHPGGYAMIVSSIDSIIINGQFRKRWNFDTVNISLFNNTIPYIIQGVGTSFGLIEPINTFGFDFTDRYLVCVKDSSSTVFVSSYNSSYGCNLLTGLNEIVPENKIQLYPNPFSRQATLLTEIPLDNATLTITNCFGQVVREMKNIRGQTLTLRRDNLEAGFYFVQLTQNNEIITTLKIVILD